MTQPQTFICEDIMIEIFSRLPVKSLLRFQCLSKSSESLISNQNFVKSHLQRSQKNTKRLLFKYIDYLRSFSLVNDHSLSTIVEDFDFGSRLKSKYRFNVVGSCNGLVCLVGESFHQGQGTKYLIYLWNPSTRSFYKVRLLVHSRRIFRRTFAMFGFGYDSLSDTYKVVVVHHRMSNNYVPIASEVHVYNKRDNRWRNIQNFPGFDVQTINPGIYLNGTINWFATSNFDHYRDTFLYIVSLDLGNETYKQLSLPSCFHQAYRVAHCRVKPSLGILKDRLCFSYDDVKITHFILWQMNEYGIESSWTQLLKLSYQAIQIDQECILPPLGTFKNDYLILIESVDGKLQATILYGQEGNTEIPKNKLWLYTNDYVPSLVAP